jgi:ATP-dependent Clp protease ATP-binding subunit ClpA
MFERFSGTARSAVGVAAEQARSLHSSEIGSEHLLLALVIQGNSVLADCGFDPDVIRATIRATDSTDVQDAEALRAIGIDLSLVQAAVEANIGPGVWVDAGVPRRRRLFGRPLREPFGAAARKSLEVALREVIARHDRTITDEHLILGMTRDPSAALRAIVEARLPITSLRERATAALNRADAA